MTAVSDVKCAFIESFVHLVGHVEGADDVEAALYKIRRNVSYFAHIFLQCELIFL